MKKNYSLKRFIKYRLLPMAFVLCTAFIYNAKAQSTAPKITSFSPEMGPIGTIVTITGSDFNTNPNDNIVFFGGVKAVVNSATATQLQVTAPAGASRQPITVLNTATELIGYSAKPYNITINNANGKAFGNDDFENPLSFPATTNEWPGVLKVGDLDGDGKNDVVIGYYSTNAYKISVFQNTSSANSISFSKFDLPTTSVSTMYALALGDLNGDGKLDLVTGDRSNGNIDVFLNMTNSSSINFATPKSFNVNAHSLNDVVIADIDGDGKSDIITTNSSTTIGILRNTSISSANITFAGVETFPIAESGANISITDLNNDNKPDIIVGSDFFFTQIISILPNQSTPGIINSNSFGSYISIPLNSETRSIVVADLNGDDLPEIVATKYSISNSNNISVFKNKGNYIFDQVDFSVTGQPYNIGANDFDGDGKLDLFVTTSMTPNRTYLMRNKGVAGNISFETAFPTKVVYSAGTVLEDFDNDGKADFGYITVTPSNFNVSKNKLSYAPVINSFSPSSGAVGTSVTLSGAHFSSVIAENNVYFGGIKAIVTAATPTQLTVIVPLGATGKTISVLNTRSKLIGISNQNFKITFNNAIGKIFGRNFILEETTKFQAGSGYPYQVYDLNGDGKNDLLLNTNSSLEIYLNTTATPGGEILVKTNKFTLTTAQIRGMEVGDLNNDGQLDIVLTDYATGKVRIFINNTTAFGSLSFFETTAISAINPDYLTLTDVDGDGKLDIVFAETGTASIRIFKNEISSNNIGFINTANITTNNAISGLYANDLDGDGKPEIIAPELNQAFVSIFKNNNDIPGIIDAASFSLDRRALQARSEYMTIADVDGDGKTDIAYHIANSNVHVLRNASSVGIFNFVPETIALPSNSYRFNFGDLDGDGKLDLFVPGPGGVYALKSNSTPGNISFSNPYLAISAHNPAHVFFADLNNDGKPDLFVGDGGDSRIYRNNIDIVAPNAPANLTATANSVTLENTLTWTANTETDLDGYKVYGGTTANPTTLLATITTVAPATTPVSTYVHTNLMASTAYYYRIIAFDKTDNESNYSNEVVSGIKIPQTITFNAINPVVFGDPAFNAGVTSTNSSIALAYNSSNPSVATIDNTGQIQIVGVGTTTITASQPGNNNYDPAISVSQQLTVNQASQAITFNAINPVIFGTASFNAGVTSTNSTIPVTYNSSNTSVATIDNTGQIQIVGAGITTITASQAGNTNYSSAASVAHQLTVNQAPQAITFNAINPVIFGTASFNVGVTSTNSTIPVSYNSSNPNVATIDNAGQIQIVGVGTTTITASQPGNANYSAAASVAHTLTVNQATQTITFNAINSVVFGSANFNVGVTSTNSTIPISYNSSNPGVATIDNAGQIQIVGVGTTTITASQPGNANYSAAASVAHILTVTKATQTITFAAIRSVFFRSDSFNAGATSTNSTIPITYISSNTNVATIVNGNQIQIVGIGTTTITASQAGDQTYNPATSVTQQLTVTKAIQTITFAAIPDQLEGNADYTLNATATSGLAVSYTSDNAHVVTIVNGKLHIVSSGTANITASQAGDANYSAATSVIRPVIVTANKKEQKITASNVLTPNKDGKNDTWVIANILEYPQNEVTIFNRSGKIIYYKKGYANEWDGTYNGSQLEQGVYYYIIKLDNNSIPVKGTISLIRNNK